MGAYSSYDFPSGEVGRLLRLFTKRKSSVVRSRQGSSVLAQGENPLGLNHNCKKAGMELNGFLPYHFMTAQAGGERSHPA